MAKWIKIENKHRWYKCSNCGRLMYNGFNEEGFKTMHHFCGRCGANMMEDDKK